MVQFEELAGLKLSQLKDCKIEASDGQQIGRLIDAVFKNSPNGIQLTKFIVGGSRFEEFMERWKLRDDIDPVFKTDVIDKVSPKVIKLTVPKSDLKSTHIHQDAIDEDEIKLSEISKLKVVDSKGDNIGNIMDLKFEDNSFKFILGDSRAKEWAEAVGLVADVDFLITPNYISGIERQSGVKCVCLNKQKGDLKSTFEKYVSDQSSVKQSKIDSRVQAAKGTIYFPGYR